MQLIATGDFGGNVEIASRLLDIDYNAYDCAVFTGDMIAMKELRKIGEATATGAKVDVEINYADIQSRMKQINKVFKELKQRTKLYGILGNSDLRKTFISLAGKLAFKNIHNRVISLEGYFLVGYQGRPMNIDEFERPDEIEKSGIFPNRTYGERAKECNGWPEEKAYNDLHKLLSKIDPRKSILVTHYPPYMILDKVDSKNIPWAMATFGERAKDGNIGSVALKKISQAFPILAHLFSHVHEARGIEEIGQTVYVNGGSLEEDQAVCKVVIHEEAVDIDFLKI